VHKKTQTNFISTSTTTTKKSQQIEIRFWLFQT